MDKVQKESMEYDENECEQRMFSLKEIKFHLNEEKMTNL